MDLSVVYMKMGGAQLPVTDSTLVVVPYTAWRFVLHACEVLGPTHVKTGFVGQSDFMFKVCWQGYTLGALGIQVWRWTDSRPRDSHSTDIMLANHRPPRRDPLPHLSSHVMLALTTSLRGVSVNLWLATSWRVWEHVGGGCVNLWLTPSCAFGSRSWWSNAGR